MEIKKAQLQDVHLVYCIVQDTIRTVYPKYYPSEVVDFFSNHHTMENILEDVKQGNVLLLWVNEECVATGSLHGNEICRVFVLPQYQGMGYGHQVMDYLESTIAQFDKTARIDSSLPGSFFYEKRQYKPVQHDMIVTQNDVQLVYEIMEKRVRKATTAIDYEGKRFVPYSNSEHGEVSSQTQFIYHQDGTLFWAFYEGGDVVKGFMIGSVQENGDLTFHYQHVNLRGVTRIGQCHSATNILENGKLELHETWEWLNGDKTKGTSIIREL